MKACCTGCRAPPFARPSTVVMCAPSYMTANVRHELTRRPSISTVQAPHWPWSQPFFVPVRSRCSRNTSSSVVRGSSVSAWRVPFTVRFTGTEKAAVPLPVSSFLIMLPVSSFLIMMNPSTWIASNARGFGGVPHANAHASLVRIYSALSTRAPPKADAGWAKRGHGAAMCARQEPARAHLRPYRVGRRGSRARQNRHASAALCPPYALNQSKLAHDPHHSTCQRRKLVRCGREGRREIDHRAERTDEHAFGDETCAQRLDIGD